MHLYYKSFVVFGHFGLINFISQKCANTRKIIQPPIYEFAGDIHTNPYE